MTTSIATPPKLQFFDSNGVPLSGGKLYSYAAGTTTPLATYTSSSGGTANTNPIILDSRGEANVWLNGVSYKLKLTSSTDVEIWTVDNLNGADQATLAALAASSGSSLVGYTQGGSGAVATTVQSKLRQLVSVMDFGATGDGATDDTTAISNAIQSMTNGGILYFPSGTYLCSSSVVNATTIPQSITFLAGGAGVQGDTGGTQITYSGTGICFNIQFNTGTASIGGWRFQNFEFKATNAAGSIFQWNDYTLTPASATPPRTIRQVQYSQCTFSGPSGASVTGFAISGMKVFELTTDDNCEFYGWNKAIRLKGCDNCVIKGRFQSNVVDLEHLRSGTFGNNLLTHGTFLSKNTSTGSTNYSIYSTGFQDLHLNPYIESSGTHLYLNGYAQTVLSPWNSTSTSAVYIETGSSLTACNILYPKISATQTATLTLANSVAELRIVQPSTKWLSNVASSLPNPACLVNAFYLNTSAPIDYNSTISTSKGVSLSTTYNLTPWVSPTYNYSTVLTREVDANGYLGYTYKAAASVTAGGGGIALTCGVHFEPGDTLRISYTWRLSGARTTGTTRRQILKGGTSVTNVALTDPTTPTTYQTQAYDYNTSTTFAVGDVLNVGFYNANSDVDAYLSAITVEVCQYIFASVAWDPINVANGAQTTTTVTATGAKLGDFVAAALSTSLSGLTLTAYVSAADTVTAVLANTTGGAVDIVNSTLRVRVYPMSFI